MQSLARFRAAFGVALAAAVIAPAHAASLEKIGGNVPGFYQAGAGGFAVADFDGDGKSDLVIPAINGANALFEVYGDTGSGLAVKQIVLLGDAALVRVLVANANGTPHLVTIARDGTVREFGGWPLAELRHFTIGADEFSSAALGDIDADGHDEIVIAESWPGPTVSVYDFDTGALRWTLAGVGGADVLLEQLDADPALEIVLANTPGTIIDGATQATDWSWKDGFGTYLAAGHFEAGGGAQFVAARDWDLFTIFQSAPYSPVWDAEVFNITAIAAADLDGDGLDEIIEGDGQWGAINVYSGQTHAVTLSIPNSGWGVSALAAVDFTGTGATSIAYGSVSAQLPDEAVLGIFDAATGAPQLELYQTQPGPYAPVAIGDVDGDGAPEFFFASEGTVYTQGLVTQIDALSGDEEWQSPAENGNADDPWYMTPAALRVIPGADGDAGSLIVAGTSIYSGRILKIDGATHDVVFQIGQYASGPMNDRDLADIAIDDFNGDGTPEIVACTSDNGASGARIQVFSSVDGSQIWESVAMGTGFERCNGVMAGIFDDAANPLAVAVLPDSLRAFDAATHLVAWTLPVAADGATLLQNGVGGREFAVFSGSSLVFHDARTRAELRRFDLGEPILAVREPRGIDTLVVAIGGRLLIVDGRTGQTRAVSEFLGDGIGRRNQLAIAEAADHSVLIGAGSDVGAFRYRLSFEDPVFANGFDP
jgi:hypothetical protein